MHHRIKTTKVAFLPHTTLYAYILMNMLKVLPKMYYLYFSGFSFETIFPCFSSQMKTVYNTTNTFYIQIGLLDM